MRKTQRAVGFTNEIEIDIRVVRVLTGRARADF
jgi:hypothetical protein